MRELDDVADLEAGELERVGGGVAEADRDVDGDVLEAGGEAVRALLALAALALADHVAVRRRRERNGSSPAKDRHSETGCSTSPIRSAKRATTMASEEPARLGELGVVLDGLDARLERHDGGEGVADLGDEALVESGDDRGLEVGERALRAAAPVPGPPRSWSRQRHHDGERHLEGAGLLERLGG